MHVLPLKILDYGTNFNIRVGQDDALYRESETERRGHLAKSCLLVLHFPRSLAWKVLPQPPNTFFLCICNYFIKYYISLAAQSCLVQRKFGVMAQSPTHIHTNQHPSPLPFPLSHSVLLPLFLSLWHSPAVPVLPQADWSQEGATFFEFMGGLSHTVPASGFICNLALLFITLPTAMIQMEF